MKKLYTMKNPNIAFRGDIDQGKLRTDLFPNTKTKLKVCISNSRAGMYVESD